MNSRGVTAEELLEMETSTTYRAVVTFSRSIDCLLGGGIKPGSITEVFGASGLGKTTFCLQLCMNVQIPRTLEGLQSEALYIDTEISFVPKRARQIAHFLTAHCKSILPKCRISENRLMNGIHLIQCRDYSDLEKVIVNLKDYVQRNTNIRLIVVDSLAFPFYTRDDGFHDRSKPLYSIGQVLHHVAGSHGIAVVVTNNLTTRFDNSGDGGGEKNFVPYLGESWDHIPNQRLFLHWGNGGRNRVAELVKSSHTPCGSVNYKVTAAGIRE